MMSAMTYFLSGYKTGKNENVLFPANGKRTLAIVDGGYGNGNYGTIGVPATSGHKRE